MPSRQPAELPWRNRRLLRLTTLPLLAAGLAAGCEKREEITVYQAPKEPPKVAVAPEADAAPAGRAQAQWDVPEGWTPLPAGQMRQAAFSVSASEPDAVVTVISLGESDLLPNVNRWAGQIGLPPLSEADLPKAVSKLDTAAGAKADVVDLTGPEAAGKPRQRLLAAILPNAGMNWYFKLTGSADLVAAQKPKFEAFVRSVRFGGPGSTAAQGPAAPTGPLPADHPPLGPQVPPAAPASPPVVVAGTSDGPVAKWTTPAGWARDADAGAMRLLSFKAASAGGVGDVSVTRLPPSDPLANVNRWRGQVGLPPVADLNAAGGEKVTIAGGEALLFDVAGPQQRILAAMAPRGVDLYFFKMTGPAAAVAAQKDAFKAFVSSVQFAGN